MKNMATLGALALSVATSSVCLAESSAVGSANTNMNQVHVVSHALAAEQTGYSAAGRLGYKWSQQHGTTAPSQKLPKAVNHRQSGYKWSASTESSSENTAETSGFEWGVLNSSEQAGSRWGNRSFAEQAGSRWGNRSFAEQAGSRWGNRSFAEQAGSRWGNR